MPFEDDGYRGLVDTQFHRGILVRRKRSNSHRKNGPPSSAVMMPMGISARMMPAQPPPQPPHDVGNFIARFSPAGSGVIATEKTVRRVVR